MSESGFLHTVFGYEKYMPHGYCLLWQPELVWMHVISDIAVTLAYYSIPITLLYLVRKRGLKIPYRWVFVMFAIFICLCGTTHLIEVVVLWYPMYYFQGIMKALTAAASLATALLMFPLIPTLLEQFRQVEEKDLLARKDKDASGHQ